MTAELLLPLELTRPDRCTGSDSPPWRTSRGRAVCDVCGKRFALRTDGMVRRHAEAPRFLPVRTVDKPESLG